MAGELIRIVSDVHYGDHASRVRHLDQLRPLLKGADHLVFNGDTLDTRVGPYPQHTAACREEVLSFARSGDLPVTFLTGNHDPDLSSTHWLDLSHGRAFVIHGDILFDDIVPWGRDAGTIRRRIRSALGSADPKAIARVGLPEKMAIWRAVAGSVPQRHQFEPNLLKYVLHFAVDTVWPPSRFFRILGAWKKEPVLAMEFVRRQRPDAGFIIVGHTHRPMIRRDPGQAVVINTGSFAGPLGAYAVDISENAVQVRRIEKRTDAFHPGSVVAEFPVAAR